MKSPVTRHFTNAWLSALRGGDAIAKRWLAWSHTIERRQLACGARPRVGMRVRRLRSAHAAYDNQPGNPWRKGAEHTITSLLGGDCGLVCLGPCQMGVSELERVT